jgi:hypothetical protein
LFNGLTPYTVDLCEADPVSKECKKGSDSIRANGVGGLFLPLALHWSGMKVSQQSPSDAGWTIDASIQSKVDAIPPLCRTAHGQILLRDNDTITVQLRNFYCNWVVIGNVLVNADLSIDHIDSHNKAFTGFYKITFHGTGNAAGSGYYKAVIVPPVAAIPPLDECILETGVRGNIQADPAVQCIASPCGGNPRVHLAGGLDNREVRQHFRLRS